MAVARRERVRATVRAGACTSAICHRRAAAVTRAEKVFQHPATMAGPDRLQGTEPQPTRFSRFSSPNSITSPVAAAARITAERARIRYGGGSATAADPLRRRIRRLRRRVGPELPQPRLRRGAVRVGASAGRAKTGAGLGFSVHSRPQTGLEPGRAGPSRAGPGRAGPVTGTGGPGAGEGPRRGPSPGPARPAHTHTHTITQHNTKHKQKTITHNHPQPPTHRTITPARAIAHNLGARAPAHPHFKSPARHGPARPG